MILRSPLISALMEEHIDSTTRGLVKRAYSKADFHATLLQAHIPWSVNFDLYSQTRPTYII